VKLQRTNRLRSLAAGAVAVSGALVLTACGTDQQSGQQQNNAAPAPGDITCEGKGNILAAGSSAQANAMNVWTRNYQSACPETKINYKPDGSGAGIQQFLQGTTAFAGSDSALTPEEIKQSQKVCTNGQAIDLPMVGGPIAVGYHLPGVEDLVLDAETLSKIFDSKITKWNDPALKKLNPEADLPSTRIQAFHRSDDSGTTDNFTKYLHAAAPESWTYEPAKKWAAKGGQSADGSSGIATNVKQNEGAIGYFELSYASGNDIPTAALDTGAGKPVQATTANASKAIAEAQVVGEGKDLALQLDYTTKADGAYPMVLVTYEILCSKGNEEKSLAATKSFLNYVASEDGQEAITDIDYAPMPKEIITKVRDTIGGLS
jgi:phosphate transport system substrate-binding protein